VCVCVRVCVCLAACMHLCAQRCTWVLHVCRVYVCVRASVCVCVCMGLWLTFSISSNTDCKNLSERKMKARLFIQVFAHGK
jgi:hypothetical protein